MSEAEDRHTKVPVKSITIVVPCYNEAPAIAPLSARLLPILEELQSFWKVQLLCIDDGSTDDTLALLRKHFEHAPGVAADIVSHSTNFGLAEAMRTAFSASSGEIVCVVDCNSSYAPEEVRGMIHLLQNSGADIVTASPYHPNGISKNLPAWKAALSRALSRLHARLLPGNLTCYTTMFRVYRRRWFKAEYVLLKEFNSVVQILVDAILAGAKVVEYPIAAKQLTRSTSTRRWVRAACRHMIFVAQVQRRNFINKRRPQPAYVPLPKEAKRGPSSSA